MAKAVQKSRSFLLANTSLTVHQVEAILTAVSSEASYLHTLDLSNNLLSVLEPKLLGDALMTLESATLYDIRLTVSPGLQLPRTRPQNDPDISLRIYLFVVITPNILQCNLRYLLSLTCWYIETYRDRGFS